MKLTNIEKETVINFNEAGRTARLGGLNFELPKKWLKVSPPRKPTPAQLEVLARMTQKRLGK